MWPCATNPATFPSSPMPDLTPTRLLLEAGVRENRWAGFTLAAFSATQLFTLHGGCVTDPSDSVPWYSAGKPVTALGVLSLLTRAPQLDSTPLQTTFPELASSYFGGLNLTDVLTHRTGLRFPNLPVHSPAKEIFAILAKAEPRDFSLLPCQAAYDPRGGWWLLGQWLARQTQIPWEDFLHQKILQPARAGHMFFASPSRLSTISMMEKKAGHWTAVPPSFGPGSGLCGSATDLARLYHTLISNDLSPNRGHALLDQVTYKKFTHRWREGEFDATFGHIIDFGLGVILDSNRYGPTTVPYGFGTHSSPTTFGHGGARSSIAFVDPEKHLAVALCLLGLAPENIHQPRMRSLLDQLRSDLA